jgi:serine/threonine-protein kinase
LDRIGPYRIVSSLGSGGMAEVYLAERRGPSGFLKRFAIKVVKPVDAEEEEESRRRFEAEARLSAILEHPNIVKVYDFVQYPRPYLVMEYVDGVSLLGLLRKLLSVKDKLPVELAAFVVAKMARGLEHAHVQCGDDGEPLGLIHRDVSAANVLLSYQGEVKLSDFGIAQAVSNAWKTMSGTVLGKTSYMSPEQARGEPIDARSDVFSAGVVLWELLCLRPLYPQTEPEAQRRRSQGEPAPRADEQEPSVDRDLADIAAHALDPDLRTRIQSAGQLADELDDWLSRHRARSRDRALGAFLEKHFPRKESGNEEEATLVETALPDAVRERIEAEMAKKKRPRRDETPTAADARPFDEGEDGEPAVSAAAVVMAGEGAGGEEAATLVGLGTLPASVPTDPGLGSGRRSTAAPAPKPHADPERTQDGVPTLVLDDQGGAEAVVPSSSSKLPRRVPRAAKRKQGKAAMPEDSTSIRLPAFKPSRAPLVIGIVVAGLLAAGAAAYFLRPAWLPFGLGTPPDAALPPAATWAVRSQPSGFRIFVNDQLVGTTPVDVPWSAVPPTSAVTAMREGYPPLVALGRSLEGYRMGLREFPGAMAPYPPGAAGEGESVALHLVGERIVGYSMLTFRDGVANPAEESVVEEGASRRYRHESCRPSVPCVVRPE